MREALSAMSDFEFAQLCVRAGLQAPDHYEREQMREAQERASRDEGERLRAVWHARVAEARGSGWLSTREKKTD